MEHQRQNVLRRAVPTGGPPCWGRPEGTQAPAPTSDATPHSPPACHLGALLTTPLGKKGRACSRSRGAEGKRAPPKQTRLTCPRGVASQAAPGAGEPHADTGRRTPVVPTDPPWPPEGSVWLTHSLWGQGRAGRSLAPAPATPFPRPRNPALATPRSRSSPAPGSSKPYSGTAARPGGEHDFFSAHQ